MRTSFLLFLVAFAAGCRSFTEPEDRVINDRRFGQLVTAVTDDHLVLLDQKSGQIVTTEVPGDYAEGFSQGAIFLREGTQRLAEASFNGALSEEHFVELYGELLHVSADLVRLELELGAAHAGTDWCDEEEWECEDCDGCTDCAEFGECLDECEELIEEIETRTHLQWIEFEDGEEVEAAAEQDDAPEIFSFRIRSIS